MFTRSYEIHDFYQFDLCVLLKVMVKEKSVTKNDTEASSAAARAAEAAEAAASDAETAAALARHIRVMAPARGGGWKELSLAAETTWTVRCIACCRLLLCS